MVYHILDRVPRLEGELIAIEYEELAQALKTSGLVRIEAEEKCNFTRFTYTERSTTIAFSEFELTDPLLLLNTKYKLKNILSRRFPNENIDKKIEKEILKLKKNLEKFQKISDSELIKILRALVQAAHPIVFKWILRERVEIFLSFGHSIGEIMDVTDWKSSGSNSGMQSTDGFNARVFVSCGGNPLGENSKEPLTYGDGFPALARLLIIAAQELGHYADIMRDNKGAQISRHSANFSGTKAKDHVKAGLRKDLDLCFKTRKTLRNKGLINLVYYEKSLKFYRKNKLFNIKSIYSHLMIFIYKYKLLKFTRKNQMWFVERYKHDEYMGLTMEVMFEDMIFNLWPQADVYKRDNFEAEEAIACIEALARIPQQSLKWGHLTTSFLTPSLYHVYYNEVIPSLVNIYENITAIKFIRNLALPEGSLFKRIKCFFLEKREYKFLKYIRTLE